MIICSNFQGTILTELTIAQLRLFVHKISVTSSEISEEQSSCGSVHVVSTANHKHSQIVGR